jgi:8-amino-7-oxononanoate synthase
VVADGWCPGCGSTAPIGDYLEAVVARGGLLVVDDTQALGLLGSRPLWDPPFGKGGGGILKWLGIHPGSNILVIASLAKGFGVPMTVMAGSRKLLLGFEARSEARVHLSPVSMVDVRAAEHALTINQRNGDAMRRHLAANVMRFQAGVVSLGLRVLGGLFPVQAIPASRGLDPVALHRQLLGRGIRGVVVRPPCQPGPTLAFLLTTRHASDHVDHALAALAASLRCSR